jgi:hypothetical protein
MQVAHVHLRRLFEKVNYPAAHENIIMWNYVQNIFYTLLAYTAALIGAKNYSILQLFILMWQ